MSPRIFGTLPTQLRREGADVPGRGRPWKLALEDRVLLVAAYWRTNLTLRQLALLFGVSKSTAEGVINPLGPQLALQPRKRFAKDAVLIVDGTLVPTRDHNVAGQSKNYRCSTNHQVVIDADSRFVVVIGQPLPGNRSDCRAWIDSGAKAAVGKTTTIDDGGYRGTGPGSRTVIRDVLAQLAVAVPDAITRADKPIAANIACTNSPHPEPSAARTPSAREPAITCCVTRVKLVPGINVRGVTAATKAST